MNKIPYIHTTNIVQHTSHQKILHSVFFKDQGNIKEHKNSGQFTRIAIYRWCSLQKKQALQQTRHRESYWMWIINYLQESFPTPSHSCQCQGIALANCRFLHFQWWTWEIWMICMPHWSPSDIRQKIQKLLRCTLASTKPNGSKSLQDALFGSYSRLQMHIAKTHKHR